MNPARVRGHVVQPDCVLLLQTRKERIMSFEAWFLYLPRLIGFLITFPLRLLGFDFDWGIR